MPHTITLKGHLQINIFQALQTDAFFTPSSMKLYKNILFFSAISMSEIL